MNGTLEDAREVINQLPISDRIIIEAGTPFIKKYGENGIRQIRQWYEQHLLGQSLMSNIPAPTSFGSLFLQTILNTKTISPPIKNNTEVFPYIVADLKTMDRGETEVEIAIMGGASAAIALGTAPTETLNSFIEKCEENGLDSMIDMMNVEFPLSVLRSLKKFHPWSSSIEV